MASLRQKTRPSIQPRMGAGQNPTFPRNAGRAPSTMSPPIGRRANDAYKDTFGPVQQTSGGTGGPKAANAPVQAAAAGGAGHVTLSWAAPTQTGGSPVIAYEIWRSATTGTETFLTTVGPETLTHDDAVAAGTYFYKIAARNAAGLSALSNEQSGTAT